MYFRTKKTPSGQVLQLLESYRDSEGRSRNRVVISLGNAGIDEDDRPIIAKAVEKNLYGIEELLKPEYSKKIQRWIDKIIRRVDLQGRWQPLIKATDKARGEEAEQEVIDGVVADKVEHTKTTILGPSLVGWHVWQELKMDECLRKLGFNPAQEKVAAASVINRLVDPVSENAMGDWLEGTSLVELLGEDILTAGKDRFYRMSDKLLENQKEIESHVRYQQRQHFSIKRTIFLYDLTNTYFEGKAEKNEKAKRGKSKHKRNDCPQIVVGMVFDEHGFELAHQTFEGNRNDSTTLLDMIEGLQSLVQEEADLFSIAKPTVIVDAGIATKKNLKIFRQKGFHYLVNDSRRGRVKYRDNFLQETAFEDITNRKEQINVKVCKIKEPDKKRQEEHQEDMLVLCKSANRRQKEEAIRTRAEERFLQALERLSERLDKGRLIDKAKIDRSIGRITSKHTRVARFYTVTVEERPEQKNKAASYQLKWFRDDAKYQTDDDLLGCYVLRTDRKELTATEIWQLYITLTRAEDGFRALKSDLGLRPIRHHLEERGDAHIFITVLAYHLLQHILYTLRNQADIRSWQTVKRLLQTHCYTTIVLPTKEDGIYRIRKAGVPEEKQKSIYKALGVDWKKLPVIKGKANRRSLSTL